MLQFFSNIIHLINILTIVYMIFKEKRPANSIISWMLILYLAPLVGFIIYILVGRRLGKTHLYGVKESERKVLQKYHEYIKEKGFIKNNNSSVKNTDMILSLESMDFSPYRDDNTVELFSDGKDFFTTLLESLNQAKNSINIQFYIFKNDEIGSQILKILEKKALDGVDVRFLYDSVGSRSLKKDMLKPLIDAGVKIGEFFPSWLKIINLNMNFRNHRKIVVIDNKIGFVGGFNVGDEYLGKDKKFGYWRDTHIKFEGSAVRDLNLRFLGDWRYATKEEVNLDKDLVIEEDYSRLPNEGMQILSSGPNVSDRYEIKLGYLKMIQKAKNYIYIQSPYLIIDKTISDSLKLAALSGVDVRVMIPGKGDHPFVYWANLSYAGELLEYGVKIYHYDKNSFLHAKTVVIDDEICSVGTANMDTRSFELNFEVNAFIYSEKIARQQKKEFEKDLLKSTELTQESYNSRGRNVVIKESFSILFSSLL